MTEDNTKSIRFYKMKTKIYCDIAEYNLIKKYNKKKINKRLTTNIIDGKAGAKIMYCIQKILKVCKKTYIF